MAGSASLTLLLLTLTIGGALGGRIMFYMPFVSKSMEITYMPLAIELAKKGHKVTLVTPFELKDPTPNMDAITIHSGLEEMTNKMSKDVLSDNPSTKVMPIFELLGLSEDSNDQALGHPKMKELTGNPATKFDVVIMSSFILNEAGYYLAHRFDASLVLYFTGQTSFSSMDYAMGQPHNPAYLPLILFDFHAPLTFAQRLVNTVGTMIFQYFIRDYYMLSKVDALLDKHFPGVSRPDLRLLESNASLAFTFGHPLISDGLRPVSPNHQYLGMMNCRPAKPLPKDLQDFMDSGSKNGVIYVSFGSVLQASEMSAKTRKLLLSAFRRLEQKIIWKWETETMEGKPDNVKLSKWLPQQDILAHKNTRLFVTHGGQSSSQEALCHQKPSLVISVVGDQHANGREAERVGCGISLPFSELTEEGLHASLRKILDDPKYTDRAKEHGSLLTDQITQPMERAVWWIEYLIRHPGKNHMRSPVHDLAWYQYFLLDVMAFIVFVVALFVFVLYKIVACVCCRRKKTVKVEVDKKKKRS